ncbi:hypothetical protein JCM1393_04430 [Clostridium carnis]
MPYRDFMSKNYSEISNLNTMLNSMVNSYRLLIGGAGELNNIAPAKKSQVKDAIERAEKLGEIIDSLIKTLDGCSQNYCKYCYIKNQYIQTKTNKDIILTEINSELDFYNENEREEDEE